MVKSPDGDTDYTDEEIVKRRDGGLHALLKAPPKPHAEIVGKERRNTPPKPHKETPKKKD